MTIWRMKPDGRRTWYVPAHRAYAAAMTEGVELNEDGSESLAAPLRDRRQEGRHR